MYSSNFVVGHLVSISAKSCSILATGFRGEDIQRFLQRYIIETGYASWRPCFLTDQIHFQIRFFVEGHLVTVSTKLFSILSIGFRGEDV